MGLVVQLSGATQEAVSLVATVANALLMASTLTFLWLLACADGPAAMLPAAYRVKGAHKWACAAVFVLCSAMALVSFVWSLVDKS